MSLTVPSMPLDSRSDNTAFLPFFGAKVLIKTNIAFPGHHRIAAASAVDLACHCGGQARCTSAVASALYGMTAVPKRRGERRVTCHGRAMT